MSNYDNTNRGAIFKNDKKDSENHPDYKGQINANGVDFWVSAWIKTDQKNKKYMSLSIAEKEQRAPEPKKNAVPQSLKDMDDEIPF